MSGFYGETLLELIGQGEKLSQLERTLLLLCAARPEVTEDMAWDWSVGDRDRAIWKAWIHDHNEVLEAVSICPECGEIVEFELPLDFALPDAVSDHASLEINGKNIKLRLPTSRDMHNALMGKMNLRMDGGSMDELLQPATDAALEAADPGLDMLITHDCPACATIWKQSLDVCRYVWQDCEMHAKRLFHDIDIIARVYGWSEQEILTLSEQRRLHYVSMIRDQSLNYLATLYKTKQVLS